MTTLRGRTLGDLLLVGRRSVRKHNGRRLVVGRRRDDGSVGQVDGRVGGNIGLSHVRRLRGHADDVVHVALRVPLLVLVVSSLPG